MTQFTHDELWRLAGDPVHLPEKWCRPSVAHYANEIFCVTVQTPQLKSVLVGKYKLREAAWSHRDLLLMQWWGGRTPPAGRIPWAKGAWGIVQQQEAT